jgi:hydroxyethylthiazole kinase-like uncharacterized protein yjeF
MRSRSGPVRVDPLQRAWPLHDEQATRQAERLAAAEQTQMPPMERAGHALARLAVALAPQCRSADVWCGPGNNGGDGLVAARVLQGLGWQLRVVLLGDAARSPPDALAARRAAGDAAVPMVAAAPALTHPEAVVIDALLGLGASRAPDAALAGAITVINAHRGPVLAADLPSGLHPNTGQRLGAAAVRASATLNLLTLKPGCYTGAGRDHAGEVWLDDLGAAATPPTAWLSAGEPLPSRVHASHKGCFGDVAVVGGAPGMVGAAWLAARAALAAGAGRVHCSPLDPQAGLIDVLRPELMGQRLWWQSDRRHLQATTVACGCGGGDAVHVALPALLRHVVRLVLDADALNALAGDGHLRALLQARAARGLATLVTPHPLEAARLLGVDTAAVQADRCAAAQALAHDLQVAVLLKGSGSVIAAPGTPPLINATGNAALASAGTGDVLAGWAAGIWSQAPALSAQRVGSMAAGHHGAAADAWRAQGHEGPLRASDLVEALALRRRSAAA